MALGYKGAAKCAAKVERFAPSFVAGLETPPFRRPD